MLEQYFSTPQTIDNIRACWLSQPIELYVNTLVQQRYSASSIISRVPVLMRFADFSWTNGVREFTNLPTLVEPFVTHCAEKHKLDRKSTRERDYRNEVRGPVEQMLSLALPDFVARGRPASIVIEPFSTQAPGFFPYLENERGLSVSTMRQYRHWLRRFQEYLCKLDLQRLCDLSPAVISALITSTTPGLSKSSISGFCSTMCVFLRYLHREGIISRDLSSTIDAPQKRRLSSIPRSITWDEVRLMLESVDRRTIVGIRDYAILLLLVTYGLRAREVASLSLEHIDWERERLLIPERKAGHCTAYPLSSVVGEAIVEYLEKGRPKLEERSVFFRTIAPYKPLTHISVGTRTSFYLKKAGIKVYRPGSHTLRHTCVQRLIDAEFPLATIGQFVGHRSPQSTEVYSKVDIETLRKVALGDGEALL